MSRQCTICFACGLKISVINYAKHHVQIGERHFHTSCFHCHQCKRSLQNKVYYHKDVDCKTFLYCKKDYFAEWGSPCKICGEYIRGSYIAMAAGSGTDGQSSMLFKICKGSCAVSLPGKEKSAKGNGVNSSSTLSTAQYQEGRSSYGNKNRQSSSSFANKSVHGGSGGGGGSWKIIGKNGEQTGGKAIIQKGQKNNDNNKWIKKPWRAASTVFAHSFELLL